MKSLISKGFVAVFGAAMLISATQAAAAVTVTASTQEGQPGTTVPFGVTLTYDSEVVINMSIDVSYAASTTVATTGTQNNKPKCTVNPDIFKGATSFSFRPPQCTPGPGGTCTAVRAAILATDANDPIPSGSLLFNCDVAIAAGTEPGSYPLDIPAATYATPGEVPGMFITLPVDNRVAGAIVVPEGPTVTPTPSVTNTATRTSTPTNTPEASNTPTRTNTPPPTRTPTSTPTSSFIDSDGCNINTAGTSSGAGWLLLAPAAVLLIRRRRRL